MKVAFLLGAITLEGLDWFHQNQQYTEEQAEHYANSRVGVPLALADINEQLKRNQVVG